MVSRRPHKKSRLGCQTCKHRRVKCDERGPPCGPCRSKSIECEYVKAQSSNTRSPAPANEVGQGVTGSIPSDWSPSQRTLELELFHHWTTTTYKSYCGTIDEEYHNWQVVVPKIALKHDCLLHGIFAMSALEIGAFSENGTSEEYIYHALHYQNLASSELREELSKVDLSTVAQDRHQALWALSSILMAVSLALPPFTVQSGEKYNMLDHIMTFNELSMGLVVIVHSRVGVLEDDPLLRNYKEWEELVVHPLDTNTQQALNRLQELNEETYGATRMPSQTPELQAMTYHAACRRALFFLEQTIAKCSASDTRAYGLAWIMLTGKDFLSALKAREPVALLILMHWGVFLEKQSYGIWYVERVGKYLVEDLTDDVFPLKTEKLKDSLNWAREQVGLEAVPEKALDVKHVLATD